MKNKELIEQYETAIQHAIDEIGDITFSILDNNNCEFSFYSPAGQDCHIELSVNIVDDFEWYLEDLISAIYDYYQGYYLDEQTAIWIDETGHGKNGEPYHLSDILEDMEWVGNTIIDIYNKLKTIKV